MLDLEVVPERALRSGQWEFVLGMPLYQAIEILKRECECIKKIQITYSEQNPLDLDVVVGLTQDGIRLLFDPKSQRLKMIEVYDVTKVKLRYCNKHFCSHDILPTVDQIHHSFGPTLPGQVDTKQQLFVLLFRGVLFAFPFWNATNNNSISLERSDLNAVLLSRLCIFSGNDPSEAKPPSLPLECFHGNSFSDGVEVVRGSEGDIRGLKLQVVFDDPQHSKLGDKRPKVLEREVRFGDRPQEVSLLLGAPNRVFFKDEDKMRIHSPPPRDLSHSDYFFNYFTLGLDLLFDALTHKVKKFVLHTNFPGHYNFNVYHRCDFTILFPIDKLLSNDSSMKQLSITPYTKWAEVQDFLTRPADKPVILNRTSSTNSSNPFGPTHCYGYQNLIFEVMRNSHISSVTIFSP